MKFKFDKFLFNCFRNLIKKRILYLYKFESSNVSRTCWSQMPTSINARHMVEYFPGKLKLLLKTILNLVWLKNKHVLLGFKTINKKVPKRLFDELYTYN